jgi:hypothetical protein
MAAQAAAAHAFSSAPLKGKCVRLSGCRALGDTLATILEQRPANEITLLVFDFDKTLTNGFANPEATVEQRVRGGKHTADALRATKNTPGVERFVLTARPPTKNVLESVIIQLTGAMQLSDSFKTQPDPEDQMLLEFGALRATLAHSGTIYASGYDKPTGVSHIIVTSTCSPSQANHAENQPLAGETPAPVRVHFFDDSVSNAYRVATECVLPISAVAGMVAHEVPASWDHVQLTSYWWDLFSEEFEEQTIAPGKPDMDSPYLHAQANGEVRAGPPFMYASALKAYGLSEAEAATRAQKYMPAA